MSELMSTSADTERYREGVDKLMCFTGIQTHTALSLICEVGDFGRFGSAEQFSSYLGLCPGQDSSGSRIQYNNSITKSGNTRLRLLPVEAVNGVERSNPYKKSKRIILRQSGQLPSVIAYADRGGKAHQVRDGASGKTREKHECSESRGG